MKSAYETRFSVLLTTSQRKQPGMVTTQPRPKVGDSRGRMLATAPPALLAASPRYLATAELQPAPLQQPTVQLLQPDVLRRPGTTRWIAANGSTSWPSAAVAQRASGWGHARDVENLRMALPPPAGLSRLQERLRTNVLAERDSAAAAPRRKLVRPAGRRHGDAASTRHTQAPTRPSASRSTSLPAGNALIALHGAASTMPSDQIVYAEEISCVYTKQNCTCDFDCPCELSGAEGREALWCGCEQLFDCTCEMRSGACTVGPPDDAYLFFPYAAAASASSIPRLSEPQRTLAEQIGPLENPLLTPLCASLCRSRGQQTGTGGYMAALRGEALDFGGSAPFAVEAWTRPHRRSADEDQTLVSRYNNDVAGQWILYLDGAKVRRTTRTRHTHTPHAHATRTRPAGGSHLPHDAAIGPPLGRPSLCAQRSLRLPTAAARVLPARDVDANGDVRRRRRCDGAVGPAVHGAAAPKGRVDARRRRLRLRQREADGAAQRDRRRQRRAARRRARRP